MLAPGRAARPARSTGTSTRRARTPPPASAGSRWRDSQVARQAGPSQRSGARPCRPARRRGASGSAPSPPAARRAWAAAAGAAASSAAPGAAPAAASTTRQPGAAHGAPPGAAARGGGRAQGQPRRAPAARRPPRVALHQGHQLLGALGQQPAGQEEEGVPDGRREAAQEQDPPRAAGPQVPGGHEEEGPHARHEPVEEQEPAAPAPVGRLEGLELGRREEPAGRGPPAATRRSSRRPSATPTAWSSQAPATAPAVAQPAGAPTRGGCRGPRTRPPGRSAGRRGTAGRRAPRRRRRRARPGAHGPLSAVALVSHWTSPEPSARAAMVPHRRRRRVVPSVAREPPRPRAALWLCALWLALGLANVWRGVGVPGPDLQVLGLRTTTATPTCWRSTATATRAAAGRSPTSRTGSSTRCSSGSRSGPPPSCPAAPAPTSPPPRSLLALCLARDPRALRRLPGARPWWLAATPALVYYAFLNWDLLPIALTALALLALERLRPASAGALAGAGGRRPSSSRWRSCRPALGGASAGPRRRPPAPAPAAFARGPPGPQPAGGAPRLRRLGLVLPLQRRARRRELGLARPRAAEGAAPRRALARAGGRWPRSGPPGGRAGGRRPGATGRWPSGSAPPWCW